MPKTATAVLWLAAALAEASLAQLGVALGLGLLGSPLFPSGVPPLLGLGVGYLLGSLSGRQLQRRESRRNRLLQAVAGLVAALVAGVALHRLAAGSLSGVAGSPVTVLGVVSVWYCWWQGSLAGARGITFSDMSHGFPLRSGIILAGLLAAALAGGIVPPTAPGLFYRQVATFFAAGLAALILVRNQEVRERLTGRTGPADVLTTLLTLAALGAVALGLVADVLLSSHRDLLLTWLGVRPLLALLARLLEPLILAAAWAMAPLIDLIRAWMRAALLQRNPLPLLEPGAPEELPPLEPAQPAPWLEDAVEGLVVLAALGALLLVLLRVQARRRPAPSEPQEVRESLGAWSGLRADLRAALAALWRSLLGRLRRRQSTAGVVLPAPAGPDGEPPAVQDIRAAFRRLQVIGRQLGRPRQPSQTPSAYSRWLAGALPDAGAALGRLTGLYNRVRYGPAGTGSGSLPPAEVTDALLALAEVEAAARSRQGLTDS